MIKVPYYDNEPPELVVSGKCLLLIAILNIFTRYIAELSFFSSLIWTNRRRNYSTNARYPIWWKVVPFPAKPMCTHGMLGGRFRCLHIVYRIRVWNFQRPRVSDLELGPSSVRVSWITNLYFFMTKRCVRHCNEINKPGLSTPQHFFGSLVSNWFQPFCWTPT